MDTPLTAMLGFDAGLPPGVVVSEWNHYIWCPAAGRHTRCGVYQSKQRTSFASLKAVTSGT